MTFPVDPRAPRRPDEVDGDGVLPVWWLYSPAAARALWRGDDADETMWHEEEYGAMLGALVAEAEERGVVISLPWMRTLSFFGGMNAPSEDTPDYEAARKLVEDGVAYGERMRREGRDHTLPEVLTVPANAHAIREEMWTLGTQVAESLRPGSGTALMTAGGWLDERIGERMHQLRSPVDRLDDETGQGRR